MIGQFITMDSVTNLTLLVLFEENVTVPFLSFLFGSYFMIFKFLTINVFFLFYKNLIHNLCLLRILKKYFVINLLTEYLSFSKNIYF